MLYDNMIPFCSLAMTGPQLSSTVVGSIFVAFRSVTLPVGTIGPDKSTCIITCIKNV